MIAWILYSALVSALLLVAAHAADRVVRAQGAATRWIWVVSLVGSVAVPVLWPQLPRALSVAAGPVLIPSTFTIELDAVGAMADAQPFWTVPRLVLAGWLVLSALLVLYGVHALLRLRAARSRWRAGEVNGASVLISENVGPAVVGLMAPVVVVPQWIHSLSVAEQELVLAHERAHIAARDPWLIVFSQLLPALMPWNAPVWWQARRLREALELDCDARVLAGRATPQRYAELLLSVGQRTARLPLAVAALSEPRSLLEKRIRRIFQRRPRHRVLHATGWATVAGVAVLCAFRAPLPGEPLPDALSSVEQAVEAVVPGLAADTVLPRLLNPVDVHDATRRYYPPLLRDAGVEGTPHVSLHITDAGEVAVARLRQSSGHDALDQAALRVAGVMRFSPARFNDRPIPIWFDVAVEFSRDRLSRPHPAAQAARAANTVEAERAAAQRAVAVRSEAMQVTVTKPTRPPEPLNETQFLQEVARAYPDRLRAAGIGGRVVLSSQVDETGRVIRLQVKSSSGLPELDGAAMEVAGGMKFRPAQDGDRKVSAWVDIPVDFAAAVSDARAARNAQMVDAAPVFTPYTKRPGLINGEEVSRALQRYYPPLLRNAGVSGTVNIWFLIDEGGNVVKTQLKQSSGHEALDDAAQKVAQLMVFTPAQNRDQLVKVWVDMPIVFKSQNQPEASTPAVAVSAAPANRQRASTAVTTTTAPSRAARASVAETKVTTPQMRPRAAPEAAHGIAIPERHTLSQVTNGEAVARALQRYYPPLLRDAGIGGVVRLTILVDPSGTPLKVELHESSGHDALDDAALRVGSLVRFAPTGAAGPISSVVPITFKAQ
jgi:TonB family protein